MYVIYAHPHTKSQGPCAATLRRARRRISSSAINLTGDDEVELVPCSSKNQTGRCATIKLMPPARGHWCCSSAMMKQQGDCRGQAQTSRRTSNCGHLRCGFATRRPQRSSRGQVQRRGRCDLPRRGRRRRTSGNERRSGKASNWCASSTRKSARSRSRARPLSISASSYASRSRCGSRARRARE